MIHDGKDRSHILDRGGLRLDLSAFGRANTGIEVGTVSTRRARRVDGILGPRLPRFAERWQPRYARLLLPSWFHCTCERRARCFSAETRCRVPDVRIVANVSLKGIAKAKAEGVYKGRLATIDAARVREMKEAGMGAATIAKTLGIHRASVYRLLEHAAT